LETSVAAPRWSGWSAAFVAVIAGAVLLTVAGIIVAIVVTHNQGTTRYAPDSPEGAVQRYLNLLQDGKTDQAYRLTQIDGFDGGVMTRAEFNQQFASWSQTSHQVTLNSTTVSGGDATVTVQISSFSGGPFGTSTDSTRVSITLTKTGGRWLITGPPYLP
jgi:hypothetical protein